MRVNLEVKRDMVAIIATINGREYKGIVTLSTTIDNLPLIKKEILKNLNRWVAKEEEFEVVKDNLKAFEVEINGGVVWSYGKKYSLM